MTTTPGRRYVKYAPIARNWASDLYLRAMSTGNKGEIFFINWCIHHGMEVSLPYGGQQEYDVIVDNGTKLFRVQVKTIYDGTIRKNGFRLQLGSGKQKRRKYTRVDLFAVCLYKIGLLYVIPASGVDTLYTSINPYSLNSKYRKYMVTGIPDCMK
jgi:hypothetical protein